uniref:Uncharacterized protein n=1 Tax=Arundo donax TaxID=35708 RepID=A0A0A8YHS7_ARUDO
MIGVKSHDSCSGTSFNHMRVLCDIHSGRNGLCKPNAIELISAPHDSNWSVHSSIHPSIAFFSVSRTHTGRCTELSQLDEPEFFSASPFCIPAD